MSYQMLLKIKEIQKKNYVGQDLKKNEAEFLLACLMSPDVSKECIIAGLLAFMESDKKSLHFFVNHYIQLDVQIQKLAVPMLVCTDEVESYAMLINRLKESGNDDEITVIIYSLSETHFPVEPLIVQELITDNDLFLKRLKAVLSIMGKERLKIFLMLSVHIPFEAIFTELFGKHFISQIKQKI